MKYSAMAIKTALEASHLRGVRIEEKEADEPRFTLFGRPFFVRKVPNHVEVLIPFQHESYDNRKVKAAAQHTGLPPEQRLRQVIDLALMEGRIARHARRITTQTVRWMQDDKHVGYKISVTK